MKNKFLLIGLLVWIPLLYGCVKSFDANLSLNLNILVVNGIITDQTKTQTISLSRSVSRNRADSTTISQPVTKASVTVIVDSTTRLLLVETSPGVYQLPTGFRGQVGHTYQLRFQTADGASYASSVETMVAVPPISRAYGQPHSGVVAIGDTSSAATDVFVDYQDPPSTGNFYLWRWRDYEVQTYCASCKQGRYVVRDVGPVGSGPLEVLGCVTDTSIRSYVYYDYPCRGQCWDIFYSTNLDIFSDLYTNGKLQVGHLVATIPAYQPQPALIVVEQLSLSANAYRYYKILADQTQTNGTLADSPPAPTIGNVKNITNADESVAGYFSAASVSAMSYKFNRQGLGVTKYIGLFRAETNRFPNLEDGRTSAILGNGIPSAICIPSRTRTDQLPPGWNN